MVHRHELEVERADALFLALGDRERERLDAVLLELRLDERERQARPDQRDVALQAQQIRDGPDVVLVTVREDDADDVIQAVADRLEVGKDQVDTRLVLLGEEHAAVDDQDLAVVLEHGHVPADLAEAADRDDPERSFVEGGRF